MFEKTPVKVLLPAALAVAAVVAAVVPAPRHEPRCGTYDGVAPQPEPVEDRAPVQPPAPA